jgi:predicted transposase YdaD
VKDLRALVEKEVGKEIAEEAVTLGERLIEQGVQKGMQQGLQMGQQEVRRTLLLRQLRLRFGELPEATVDRVNAAGVPQLDLWADRVITAASLDDVLAD